MKVFFQAALSTNFITVSRKRKRLSKNQKKLVKLDKIGLEKTFLKIQQYFSGLKNKTKT